MDAASDPAAFAVISANPVNSDPDASARRFLEGTLDVGSHGTVELSDGRTEWADAGRSRAMLRILHGQFIVNDLVLAYRTTGDSELIDAAIDHIADWIDANPPTTDASEMAWHDETTARRLINWLRLMSIEVPARHADATDRIRRAAHEHADLLATDEFHATGTNHGMFQDQSLLAYRAVVGPTAERHVGIAHRRLLEYFDATLSVEGVHLEHSPAYHQVVALSSSRFARFFDTLGDQERAEPLHAVSTRMADYGTHVLKPDGSFPLVGDTFARDTPRKAAYATPAYRFALTSGREGIEPAERAAVFPEAGYAVFRDAWSAGRTYVHVSASYHGSYHKHSDDLSVWIYRDGDLLTESGPNGYDYNNPLTEFAYSSHAHNTVLVDGTGLGRTAGEPGQTRVVDADVETGEPWVLAETTRHIGVVHQRRVTLRSTSVVVDDDISSDSPHSYTVLWHAAPGVEMTADGSLIELHRGDTLVATMAFDSPDAVDVVVSPDDPAGRRSLRLGGGDPVSTSVAAVTVAGTAARVSTVIRFT